MDKLSEQLKADHVSWEEVHSHIIDCFRDWPKKRTGSSVGLQRVMKDNPDYLPARYLNQFNSYRNKYCDYNLLK